MKDVSALPPSSYKPPEEEKPSTKSPKDDITVFLPLGDKNPETATAEPNYFGYFKKRERGRSVCISTTWL